MDTAMSEANGYATKEGVFALRNTREYKDIEHPSFGKWTICTLTDLDKSRHDAEAINKDGKFNRYAAVNANARMIQIGVVDRNDNLNRMFSQSDVPAIQELPSGLTTWLADEIRGFNGFEIAEDAAKN